MRSLQTVLVLGLGLSACGTGTLGTDAGVDAGAEDSGLDPAQIPDRPSLGSRVLDRAGRPFVADLLLTRGSTTATEAARSAYNALAPAPFRGVEAPLDLGAPGAPTAAGLVIQNLPLFDALDGRCGVGTLTSSVGDAEARYRGLAALLADDRIWLDVDASRTRCEALFSVELRALGLGAPSALDCGGRAPAVDAMDAMLAVLTATTSSDGVSGDSTRLEPEEPFFDLP